MKQFTFLLLLSVVIIASAFKPGTPTPKVKTMTCLYPGYEYLNATYTYTYNPDGRVNIISGSNGSKSTFTYTDNTVKQHNFNAAGIDTMNVTYYLNIKGWADSSVTDRKGTKSYERYWYDDKGYNTLEKDYDEKRKPLRTTSASITNGNIVAQSDTEYQLFNMNKTDFQTTQVTFQYINDKVNSTDNINKGMPWQGSISVNNTKVYDYVGSAGNYDTYTDDYSYDEKGRTKGVTVSSNHSFHWDKPWHDTSSVAYTYY